VIAVSIAEDVDWVTKRFAPERRLLERGQLVNDRIGRQAVHRAQQPLAIEGIGDDRVRAERTVRLGASRISNQPDHVVSSRHEQPRQRYPEYAIRSCDEDSMCSSSEDLLRLRGGKNDATHEGTHSRSQVKRIDLRGRGGAVLQGAVRSVGRLAHVAT
jgi:hypothetical protein